MPFKRGLKNKHKNKSMRSQIGFYGTEVDEGRCLQFGDCIILKPFNQSISLNHLGCEESTE